MSEQARFQEWWESTGTNSVILRAQAWSAWLARAEAEQPQPDPHIALMEAEHDDRMQPQIDRALLLRMGEVEDSCRSISVGGMTEPRKCNGCGKPLLPENAWMEDGCPCNSPRGVNSPQPEGRWQIQRSGHVRNTVGYWKAEEGLEHRCRRRDLPKVEQVRTTEELKAEFEVGEAVLAAIDARLNEQPEQWPKYYKPSQPRKTNFGKYVAYYKCVEAEKGETVHTDGTSFLFSAITPEHDRTEITESEAMWLLDQVARPQPQLQKTRVRLWMFSEPPSVRDHILSVVATLDVPPTGNGWQELHHDSEGFYVEEQL